LLFTRKSITFRFVTKLKVCLFYILVLFSTYVNIRHLDNIILEQYVTIQETKEYNHNICPSSSLFFFCRLSTSCRRCFNC